MPTLSETVRNIADNYSAALGSIVAHELHFAADRLDEAVRFLESCDCPVCLKLAGDDGDSHSDGCAVGAWLESVR